MKERFAMADYKLDDLAVFVAVGREGNFTRAAAALGISPSAVGQTMRLLEERLGVRLLTRTTRSVTRTEAGEQLFKGLAPLLDSIQEQVDAAIDHSGRPSGTVRITADEFAARYVLWPRLKPLLDQYPDMTIELVTDYGLTDIVAQRIDAGVRLGDTLAADMIAAPIAPPLRLMTVALGKLRQTDAVQAPLKNLKHAVHDQRAVDTHADVAAVFGVLPLIQRAMGGQAQVDAAMAGQVFGHPRHGVPREVLGEGLVDGHIKQGELVEVLADWCEPFEGYHLYYPSRRQHTAAFRVVLEALRINPLA
jgi:DNA-binding transcriptional LysR family regulator